MANQNPYQSPVTSKQDRRATRIDWCILGCAIAISILLAVSHWFFLENIHHRIGGVAWNALFQIFGNLFSGAASVVILLMTMLGKVSRVLGVISSLLLGMTAGCCLLKSLGIMMSV